MPSYIVFPEWLKPEVIPGFPGLRWYGLLYLVAFGTAFLLFLFQMRRLPAGSRKGILFIAFVLGITAILLCAHPFYLLFFDRSNLIMKAPWALILPFDEHGRLTGYQGMNWYGGFFGAAAVMFLFLKAKKADLLAAADLFVSCVPLAQAFGRLGNFINGELYGRLTTAPWGMMFSETESYEGIHGPIGLPTTDPRVVAFADASGIPATAPYIALPRHPTQIYFFLFECLAIWAVLWFGFRKRSPFKGFAFGLYLVLSGFVKFVIGYFREPLRLSFLLKLGPQDNPPYLLLSPFNFSLEQIFDFAMLVAGLVLLFVLARKAKLNALSQTIA